MTPKKPTSKKPAARKSVSRKATARSVAEGGGLARSNKAPAKKPQPATTKPSEMEADVLEFIQAIDDYKRQEGRPFPSWSEVLEIVKGLGYERRA